MPPVASWMISPARRMDDLIGNPLSAVAPPYQLAPVVPRNESIVPAVFEAG